MSIIQEAQIATGPMHLRLRQRPPLPLHLSWKAFLVPTLAPTLLALLAPPPPPPPPPPRPPRGHPGIDPGSLPSLAELQSLLSDSLAAGPAGRAAVHSLGEQDSSVAAGEGDVWGTRAPARTQLLQQVVSEPDALPQAPAVHQLMALLQADADDTAGQSVPLPAGVSSGPLDPTALLTGYLQAADGARPTDPRLAFLTSAVAQLEGPAAVGASFPALLGPLVQLGVLSARQVYATTMGVEAARWGGRLPLMGPSSTSAKAALSAVELTDFHRYGRDGGGEGAGVGGGGVKGPCLLTWSALCRMHSCHLTCSTYLLSYRLQPTPCGICSAIKPVLDPLSTSTLFQQPPSAMPLPSTLDRLPDGWCFSSHTPSLSLPPCCPPGRALAAHIPQEGDGGGVPPDAGRSSPADEPVASASSSYEEGPDGVQQWGVMDWPQGVPRRCSWRWRGALTGELGKGGERREGVVWWVMQQVCTHSKCLCTADM